ncbi:MAG: adenine phosphoribosyltransferase [Sorangiineae bacterium]|nr:adenine phosphoribosyltransferase [Polyangiaceae bacterium]MEB2324667.1 adenine phosphoribosyltransferase [Sorangiineae bacterium]
MAARKRSAAKPKKPVPARRSPTPRGVEREVPAKQPSAAGKRSAGPSAAALDPLGHVRQRVREVRDFPQPGVLFRDITPLLADPKAFHIVLDQLAERFVGEHVDAIVGVESRGFIFGGALAARLNASFVPVRKAGKLPYRVDRVSYSLEYGEAELEMHRDSLSEGASVVVVDDLLATGGTAAAAAELVHRQGAFVSAFAFVIELDSLGGRSLLLPTPVISLLRYE